MIRTFFRNLAAMAGLVDSPDYTRSCPHCGGVRCFGLCGVQPSFGDIVLIGKVVLQNRQSGYIEQSAKSVFSFDATSAAGKRILAACPEGSVCQILARCNGTVIQSVSSVQLNS